MRSGLKAWLAASSLSLGIGLLPLNHAQALALYQISNVSDFSPATWSLGNPGITAHIDVCVYTTLLGNYSINVSSPGGFLLTNTINPSSQIPYTLTWDDSGAGNLGSGGSQLTNNVTATPKLHPNILDPTCSTGSPAGPNARLTLNITQASMTAALSGTYKGTLTLIVGAP